MNVQFNFQDRHVVVFGGTTGINLGIAQAYAAAGQQAVSGFWAVLSGMIPTSDRAMIEELDRRARAPQRRESDAA